MTEISKKVPEDVQERVSRSSMGVRDDWQPMATAPKDGTVIDVWREEFGRHADLYWGKDSYSDAEGWICSVSDDQISAHGFTHWRFPPAGPGVETAPNDLQWMRTALEWYGEQAEAASRHLTVINEEALLAIITALSLDGGKRASDALSQNGSKDLERYTAGEEVHHIGRFEGLNSVGKADLRRPLQHCVDMLKSNGFGAAAVVEFAEHALASAVSKQPEILGYVRKAGLRSLKEGNHTSVYPEPNEENGYIVPVVALSTSVATQDAEQQEDQSQIAEHLRPRYSTKRLQTEIAKAAQYGRLSILEELERTAIDQRTYFNKKQQELPGIEDYFDDDGILHLPSEIGPLLAGRETNGRYSEADWWLETIKGLKTQCATANDWPPRTVGIVRPVTVEKEIEKHRAARSSEWRAVFDALRNYRMTNMLFEEGDGYCLVDRLSRDDDGVSIADGEMEITYIVDEIMFAIADAKTGKNSDQGK